VTEELAKKIIELSVAAKTDRWHVRRPTPEMIAMFGAQGLHPFIEQRREKGQPTGIEVLAEDYSGDDDLREAHLAFIMAAAENLAPLAQAWLDEQDAKEDRAGQAFERDLNED
jgi:hypothetical protein